MSKWLWHEFGDAEIATSSPRHQDPTTKEIEVRRAVHLALEHLDPVHVALHAA
jgi:hypothetical protein